MGGHLFLYEKQVSEEINFISKNYISITETCFSNKKQQTPTFKEARVNMTWQVDRVKNCPF